MTALELILCALLKIWKSKKILHKFKTEFQKKKKHPSKICANLSGGKLSHVTSNFAPCCLYHHDLSCFDAKIHFVVIQTVLTQHWFCRYLRGAKKSHKSCPWSKTVWSDVMGIARKICVWTKLCGFNLMDRGRRLNANIFTSIAKCKANICCRQWKILKEHLILEWDQDTVELVGFISVSNIWPGWSNQHTRDQTRERSQPSVTHWEYCWSLPPAHCATWLERGENTLLWRNVQ